MPSVAMATAMIVRQRIEEALKANFADAKTREDARKLLALSEKGGDKNCIILASAYGSLFVLIFGLVGRVPTFALLSALVTLSIIYWLVKRRRKAREEFKALLASDPNYWKPIMEKLKEIVLESGQIDMGLGWCRQTTRIVR